MASGLNPRRPGALPAEVSSFVGRRDELARLADQLRTTRLVTVTGPGGVGKTRVTLRTAADCASRFTDGVCLAELAGLRDAELLPLTVATCLGLPDLQTRSQLDAILDYLGKRQLLLILDGCEHLVDACAQLTATLLRETAGVSVIATSRQPLDVAGEHICLIPPLPVPPPGTAWGGASDPGHGDAVELFVQRAAAASPGFAITEDNREDVIRLCRRLDGIPLAIELATVRLRAVTLKQLAGRIDDRFKLLTGERRATLPHHRTLRTAAQWSYELCSPAEQLLWARLSVFAGSFDAAAAEQVCGGDPLADFLPTLIGLVDKSVVLRVPEHARYRQLDTIREFGAEKLAAAGTEDAVRDRHVSRYLAMARYLGAHPAGEDQIPRYRELRREHADVRAALNYAFARPGHDTEAAQLATELYGYWQTSGLLSEGRYWMAKVLDRFPAPGPERAWALVQTGLLASLQGEVRDALAVLAEGIPMAEQLGEDTAAGRGYSHRTFALAIAGQHEHAAASGAMAEKLLLRADDMGGLIGLDIFMSAMHVLSGKPDRAIERCARGLDRLPEDSQEQWMQGWLNHFTGLSAFMLGDLGRSAASLSRALTMKRTLDDNVGTAWCLEVLGWVAAGQQRPRRTAWLLGAAGPLWELAGSRLSNTVTLEQVHAQTERAARDWLGAEQYAMLHRRGARTAIELVVKAAIDNEDELRVLRPGDRQVRESVLTDRQREIAALVAEGLSNKDIAERLVISKRTVDSHIEHILAKLGASSRIQIAALAARGRPAPQ